MTTTKFLIIFSNDDGNINGFKLFDKTSALNFMKCVKILSNECIQSSLEEYQYIYTDENFLKIKLSPADLSSLDKLFDINENETVGIFPDAINDAYENNLITDDEESENTDDEINDLL